MTPAVAQRADAARLLRRVVVSRQTTDQAFGEQKIAPLTRELVYGSLRHFDSLAALVESHLHQPVRKKDKDIWLLMIVGAYQLLHTRIPDHAALHETVDACVVLRKPWARSLVNAVLRRCSEEAATLKVAAEAGAEPAADVEQSVIERSFDHPEWLESALRRDYPPADAEAIMRANNQRAPMALRVNLARAEPEEFRQRLEAAGLKTRALHCVGADEEVLWPGPETLLLEQPVPMAELPGYPEGLVAVQDAGAQFASTLLSPRVGERVLDACAAPGGKLFHLMERQPGAAFTALEKRPRRLAQLEREAQRLGHSGFECVAGDATDLDWWDGAPFQRVLIDAPCSGSGTLRRHPDIKVLRSEEDVVSYAGLQGLLLENLWQVLAPGGTLLYCTCSLLAAENDDVISRFLAQQPDALSQPLRLGSGRPTRFGWQLLPTDPTTDGFYYARIMKARDGGGRA